MPQRTRQSARAAEPAESRPALRLKVVDDIEQTAVWPPDENGELTFAQLKEAVRRFEKRGVPDRATAAQRQIVMSWFPERAPVEPPAAEPEPPAEPEVPAEPTPEEVPTDG